MLIEATPPEVDAHAVREAPILPYISRISALYLPYISLPEVDAHAVRTHYS